MRREAGSPNKSWSLEIYYYRAPCVGADQKARGLWERDWDSNFMKPWCATIEMNAICTVFVLSLTAVMSMSVIPTLVVTTCVTLMAVLPSIP